jgi:hypothetical protein
MKLRCDGPDTYNSGAALWLACWAHNPKVRGSKPRSATSTMNITLPGTFVFAVVLYDDDHTGNILKHYDVGPPSFLAVPRFPAGYSFANAPGSPWPFHPCCACCGNAQSFEGPHKTTPCRFPLVHLSRRQCRVPPHAPSKYARTRRRTWVVAATTRRPNH